MNGRTSEGESGTGSHRKGTWHACRDSIYIPAQSDYAFWRNPPQSMARGTDGAKHAVPHPPSFRPCHVRHILLIIRRVARVDCQI